MIMGALGRRVQLAWEYMFRYSRGHSYYMPRPGVLRRAVADPATDVFTRDDRIAEDLLVEAGRQRDPDEAQDPTSERKESRP